MKTVQQLLPLKFEHSLIHVAHRNHVGFFWSFICTITASNVHQHHLYIEGLKSRVIAKCKNPSDDHQMDFSKQEKGHLAIITALHHRQAACSTDRSKARMLAPCLHLCMNQQCHQKQLPQYVSVGKDVDDHDTVLQWFAL